MTTFSNSRLGIEKIEREARAMRAAYIKSLVARVFARRPKAAAPVAATPAT